MSYESRSFFVCFIVFRGCHHAQEHAVYSDVLLLGAVPFLSSTASADLQRCYLEIYWLRTLKVAFHEDNSTAKIMDFFNLRSKMSSGMEGTGHDVGCFLPLHAPSRGNPVPDKGMHLSCDDGLWT